MSFFSNVQSTTVASGRYVYTQVKRFGVWKTILSIVGIFVLILIASKLLIHPKIAEDIAAGPRSVTVRSVSGLSNDFSPLQVVGEVSSQSEANVLTEGAGEVKGVYASLGDHVPAGKIIAELSNARERAAVLQSEGAYDAAVAGRSKVTGGSREEQLAILKATVASAQEALAGSKTATVSSLLAAYATIDDAINRKADQMFTNPDSSAPKFSVQSADSALVSQVENARVHAQQILDREGSTATTLSESSDLVAEINKTESEARDIKNFFDQVVGALNKAVPNQSLSNATVDTYRLDANTARSNVSALLTTLSSAQDSMASKQTALSIAQKNLEQGVTGGQPEDVAAADAAVKQAAGALAGARATLEKTIIRSPIAGTINSLSVKRGDFVASFQPAVSIANNGALEVVAFVTEDEAKNIVVGSEVSMEGGTKGVVTHLSPALDPLTKKIEVRIGISDPGQLVNGQAVTLSFQRNPKTIQTTAATSTTPLLIPISALKVGSDSIVVFSVSSENKLVAHKVEIKTLLGDNVLLAGGIDPDLGIVTDARGLKEGDTVTVKTN